MTNKRQSYGFKPEDTGQTVDYVLIDKILTRVLTDEGSELLSSRATFNRVVLAAGLDPKTVKIAQNNDPSVTYYKNVALLEENFELRQDARLARESEELTRVALEEAKMLLGKRDSVRFKLQNERKKAVGDLDAANTLIHQLQQERNELVQTRSRQQAEIDRLTNERDGWRDRAQALEDDKTEIIDARDRSSSAPAVDPDPKVRKRSSAPKPQSKDVQRAERVEHAPTATMEPWGPLDHNDYRRPPERAPRQEDGTPGRTVKALSSRVRVQAEADSKVRLRRDVARNGKSRLLFHRRSEIDELVRLARDFGDADFKPRSVEVLRKDLDAMSPAMFDFWRNVRRADGRRVNKSSRREESSSEITALPGR